MKSDATAAFYSIKGKAFTNNTVESKLFTTSSSGKRAIILYLVLNYFCNVKENITVQYLKIFTKQEFRGIYNVLKR